MKTLASCSLTLLLGCGAAATPPPAAQAKEPSTADGPSIVVTPEMGHPHVGDAAPDFEVSTPEGATLRLSSLRGQVVVLAFVTSWCPFSQAEQPHLASLVRDYAGNQAVRVVIVDIDQKQEGYLKYVGKQDMGAPVYWNASADGVRAYVPPNAAPTITRDRWRVLVTSNLVIDRDGVIRFFTLTDTLKFDAELKHVRAAISELTRQPA
jgi:peroxiredoxin